MNCYALNTHLPWLEVTCCLLETLIVASLIQNSFHSSEVFFPAESVSDCSDCSQLRLKSSYCLIVANKNSRDHFTIVCSVSLLCTVDSFFRNEAKLDVANIKTLTLNSVKCPYVANPFAGYDYNNNIKLPVTSGAFMVTKRKGSFLRRGDLTGRRTDNDYLCEMDNDTYMHLAYNSSNHSRHFDLQKPCTPQHCSCNITHVNSVGKKYDTVRRSMFISFPHLIHLNLSNNIIINIEDNAFVDIKGLRVLDLSNNQIRNLHEGLFLPLTHLQDRRRFY